MKSNYYDVLLIGGGPAAITVVKSIGKTQKVGVIRPEDHSMIYCAMPYAIEGILPLEKTFKKDEIVTEAGADLIRDKVTYFDFNKKMVHTEKGETYSYNKIVIATGAEPIIPPIEGTSLKGVMAFKTESDLRKILELKSSIKQAVVVGAGAIGIELSQALHNAGIETHLIDMGEHILPNMIDSDMITDVEAELFRTGMHLHLNRRVVKLEGSEYVKRVVLDNGDKINFGNMDDCSEYSEENSLTGLVVFAVGMKVDTSIFETTDLNIGSDGIIVNDKMETNIQDVYAVGDCVQFHSAITGDIISGKLATNAVPMGRVLAENLRGFEKTYPGFYNGAATKVGDYYVGSTGLSEEVAKNRGEILTGYAELTTAFPIMPFAKKVKIKLIANKNTLKILGGQVVSFEPVTDKVDQITLAVQYGLTAEDLSLFSYSSQPYQSYFPANNLLVAASYEILEKSRR